MAAAPPQSPASASLEHHLREVRAALRDRDMDRALDLADRAVAAGVEHPGLLLLAAQSRLRARDAAAALPLLARARALSPRNGEVLDALGLCLLHLNRAREALAVLDSAIAAMPHAPAPHFHKALAFEQLGQLDGEQGELERTLAADPDHIGALNLLAQLAADRGDQAAVRELAARALALSPDEALASIALATADVATRAFAPARKRLESLISRDLDPENSSLVRHLMGDLLDGEGRHTEAFQSYGAAKQILRTHYADAHGNPSSETPASVATRLAGYFSTAPESAWRAKPNRADGSFSHVFIVGFLRSGTTLLEQALASRADVEAMEERNCLAEAAGEFVLPGGLDRLAALSNESLEPFRQSYWQKARAFGHAPKRDVFVDKMPLTTVLLPLVAKLFPDAKILFALRDPRDVVLSCFRRRFATTSAMYGLLTLEGIAAYYGQVMGLGDLYREKLGLDIYDARHESLISDFEGETRRICEFLGIAWDTAMVEFADRAAGRNIDTPNSAQIGRGLSRDGAGRWRHYARELQPVLSMLQPWVARFGYPEN